MNRAGIAPRSADELELWEVASVFGLHKPKQEGAAALTTAQPEQDRYAHLRARLDAHMKGNPEPRLFDKADPGSKALIGALK